MEVIKQFEIHCGRDISEALRKLDDEFYVPVRKYREDHVFDEDKSVKWNREEVIRKNQEQIELQRLAIELRAESTDYFMEELYRYIMDETVYGYKFSKSEAEVIWSQTLKHHDSEPWNWVDDMAETAQTLFATKEVTE